MKTLILSLASGLLLLAVVTQTACAANVTFGSGGNQFTMDFVDIGDPGNAGDNPGGNNPNPAGSVGYDYAISKYEISQNMIDAATASGLTGVTAGAYAGDKPAASVNWFEAAKFVNWMNTSQGFQAAYNFDGGGNFQLWSAAEAFDMSGNSNPGSMSGLNLYRHKDAHYFLPSVDEWYKAAYYDPDPDGDPLTDDGTYFDFATGSNTAPTTTSGGTAAGTAVYRDGVNPNPIGPADVNNAGGLSPFGTMGQNGNVIEWEETAFDLTNDSASEYRGRRGGLWSRGGIFLQSSIRGSEINGPESEFNSVGFRVAGATLIPEPSRALLSLLGICVVLMWRRRALRL